MSAGSEVLNPYGDGVSGGYGPLTSRLITELRPPLRVVGALTLRAISAALFQPLPYILSTLCFQF